MSQLFGLVLSRLVTLWNVPVQRVDGPDSLRYAHLCDKILSLDDDWCVHIDGCNRRVCSASDPDGKGALGWTGTGMGGLAAQHWGLSMNQAGQVTPPWTPLFPQNVHSLPTKAPPWQVRLRNASKSVSRGLS